MKESQFALGLIKDAENAFKNGSTDSPQIIIDKIVYKKYNFDLIKQELNKNGFEMCDLKNAPKPASSMPLKNKFLIYKK